MTGKAFDKIMDGLTDALAYAKGDESRGKAHEMKRPPPPHTKKPAAEGSAAGCDMASDRGVRKGK